MDWFLDLAEHMLAVWTSKTIQALLWLLKVSGQITIMAYCFVLFFILVAFMYLTSLHPVGNFCSTVPFLLLTQSKLSGELYFNIENKWLIHLWINMLELKKLTSAISDSAAVSFIIQKYVKLPFINPQSWSTSLSTSRLETGYKD